MEEIYITRFCVPQFLILALSELGDSEGNSNVTTHLHKISRYKRGEPDIIAALQTHKYAITKRTNREKSPYSTVNQVYGIHQRQPAATRTPYLPAPPARLAIFHSLHLCRCVEPAPIAPQSPLRHRPRQSRHPESPLPIPVPSPSPPAHSSIPTYADS